MIRSLFITPAIAFSFYSNKHYFIEYHTVAYPEVHPSLKQEYLLPAFENPSFTDRIAHAASAKAGMVEKFRARPGQDDPAVIARVQDRQRVHQERLGRQADRQRAQEDERARVLEAERLQNIRSEELELARLMQAEADAQAAQQARRDRMALTAATLVDQKASRDARYAARKLRQKR